MRYLALIALIAAAPAAAPPGAADIVRDAPAAAWRAVAPESLMLIDSPRGTVAIELAPDFAPAHVAAIRALVRAGRFDGGAVVRVQDNYVVQFAAKEVPPPATPPAELPAEYEAPVAGQFTPLGYRDAYASAAGYKRGWPVARDKGREWLVHCYAMIGVGREAPPSTGDGSELYAVSGHAPRHLDRNITLVGRVVEGFAGWTSLPRGTEALGFYKDPSQRTPLTRVRLAADVPDAPRFEVMDTASPTFRAYVEARANRRESFFLRPAGGVDLCNAPVPVRRVTSAR
ncbi:peptidylprolyl isomerase [Glacieibacterium frigidum]|uniref:Peptidylprolyl isomerase n=1 Tax=Glacieibacterium frigidum TaxID=2593303 RepID=A0A552UFB1_9SPHN|nr:peptidylprolyl isomerase [Glacieibacterium frigidum]TRW16917.1 peptidylprolyl isomerase [Glacieibacterium frigidum]